MSSTIEKLGYLAGATRFRRISERFYIDGDKIYQEAGINFKASWFPVYYVLAISESPVTVLQIAEQINFSHITVKNVLRDLEKDELVIIETNPADKRSKLISLTIKGQKLIYRLKPLWISFASALKKLFQSGHPDFLNILNRIDRQIEENPINLLVAQQESESIVVVDYKPGLNKQFHDLAGPWLTEEVDGRLKEEDGITLTEPEESHFTEGGFLFYAIYKEQIVGFVALKRLDEDSFELSELYINPNYRNLGIDLKLIERCISRSMENEARELWLQTAMRIPDAHLIYLALGFTEKSAPAKITVQEQTKKVMCLDL
ncbi:MAG: bifunctional helix-turn-helix transcriptional regulator/GNAT family N-acetyltransferase [Bacteroidota bacterium]|nr:bifunctional helix-turn-helix transcriptional regulator/GNAT family N-acetyltransferase [Bacteroidota bacterium]